MRSRWETGQYSCTDLKCDGETEKVTSTGCWMSRAKRVGMPLRQIRGAKPRRDGEVKTCLNEVSDTLLPGKSSKLQFQTDRTANRHRWAS